ncbi:hypothetical protein MTP99_018029 [Tenebrio molitor]|nr:hypothetical protein MTP99_018029 [Tenebrio molitor]
MQNYVKQILETKRREKVQSSVNNQIVPKKDIFLDYLLKLTDQDGKWSDEETIEETRTIIVAGSDATAQTLCYVLMMLAMHQDIQNKVYDEIISILEDDRSPTPADLQEMTYLERFIKESLRLFPVASAIGRFVTDDVALENYILPRGTTVLIPILHLHRDPDFWPDPLTFNPDRFLTEEVSKRHPYEYLPFSGGHRNCIGIRYAMLEMKTVLSTLLRHYRVVATTHTSISDIKLKLDVATKCVGGQKIQLEVRS